MTKQEAKWVYSSIIITVFLLLFILYLFTNYSPFYYQAPDLDGTQLLQELNFDASTSSGVNIFTTD